MHMRTYITFGSFKTQLTDKITSKYFIHIKDIKKWAFLLVHLVPSKHEYEKAKIQTQFTSIQIQTQLFRFLFDIKGPQQFIEEKIS